MEDVNTNTEFKERIIKINRVAKVVKGGKRFSFSTIVVVGDQKGLVGFGLGKANEVPDSIRKGIDKAKKSLISVPIKNGSVPYDVIGEFGAGRVFIKPAQAGVGVIAGGAVRAMLELAGYKDVVAKIFGSRNPHNVLKATEDALRKYDVVKKDFISKVDVTLSEKF
ncbi:MAG: 30S ribosomal protein S5 [Deltaproteobacteria bacterium]|nr:30S ribosomal protein S5 [Deltaproteobacteria bacterium]MCL5791689.1 30S ribosomal protein S5 [Deltaproteobacteria bacterium]